MTKCTPCLPNFPRVKRRDINIDFNGGNITSDSEMLLLRQAVQRIGLSKRLSMLIDELGCHPDLQSRHRQDPRPQHHFF